MVLLPTIRQKRVFNRASYNKWLVFLWVYTPVWLILQYFVWMVLDINIIFKGLMEVALLFFVPDVEGLFMKYEAYLKEQRELWGFQADTDPGFTHQFTLYELYALNRYEEDCRDEDGRWIDPPEPLEPWQLLMDNLDAVSTIVIFSNHCTPVDKLTLRRLGLDQFDERASATILLPNSLPPVAQEALKSLMGYGRHDWLNALYISNSKELLDRFVGRFAAPYRLGVSKSNLALRGADAENLRRILEEVPPDSYAITSGGDGTSFFIFGPDSLLSTLP